MRFLFIFSLGLSRTDILKVFPCRMKKWLSYQAYLFHQKSYPLDLNDSLTPWINWGKPHFLRLPHIIDLIQKISFTSSLQLISEVHYWHALFWKHSFQSGWFHVLCLASYWLYLGYEVDFPLKPFDLRQLQQRKL